MPWIVNDVGESVYKASLFAKEELPTWNEVYNEYYQAMFLKGDHVFDPENNKDAGQLDLYWKIPHKKFLIAVVCNQFNKMIFEDGLREELLTTINTTVFTRRFNYAAVGYNVRFAIRLIPNLGMSDKLSDEDQKKLHDEIFSTKEFLSAISNSFPYIYTIRHPEGKANPFVTVAPRLEVSDMNGQLCLYPIIQTYTDSGNIKDNYFLYTPLPFIDEDADAYKEIIEFMMTQFKEYFEGGDTPGWKDDEGNIINKKPERSCVGAGYDPAL